MTDKVIRADCDYTFDPPHVNVFIGDFFVGAFPIGDYDHIKDALGLPDVVCAGPGA